MMLHLNRLHLRCRPESSRVVGVLQPYCNPNRTQLDATGKSYGPKVLFWLVYAQFSDGIGRSRTLISGLKIMMPPVRFRVSPLLFCSDLQVKLRGVVESQTYCEAL